MTPGRGFGDLRDRLRLPAIPAVPGASRLAPAVPVVAVAAASYVLSISFFGAPASIIYDGIALGALYGLLGAAIILIYRTNRIINFAAAALGAVPAIAGVLLIVNKGISWYIAFPAAVLGGAVLGAAVDVIIIRRFSKSPRLILTVATIGVSLLLAFVAIYIPNWMNAPRNSFASAIDTPFDQIRIQVGTRPFSGDYPFSFAMVIGVSLLLAAFFKFTRVGIALRASAENADRASLLGIPVKQVGTVAWAIAGGFAALTIFLRSTLVGVPVDGTLGPTVLLYALTAAVIGRMASIPTCLFAGMGIGMLDQASVFKTGRPSLGAAMMLVFILVALLAQRSKISRADDTGVSSFQAVKEFRAIPVELRSLPEVRFAKGALMLALVALFVGGPLVVDEALLFNTTPILIYAMVAVSLVILTGWAGQISLGQFGLVGIGAAVGGGLAANHNVDFFVTLVAGGLAGAAVAVLIGLPALRVQGLYLAVTTLAFAGSVSGYVLDPTYPIGRLILPKSGNRIERPLLWGRIDLRPERTYYYLCLIFLVGMLLAARSYRRNRAGRVLIAIRDNARAAPSYAINLARNRLAAFAISGAFAAVAGVLLSYQLNAIDPSSYGIGPSLDIFVISVVGGVSALPGAVMGAVVLQFITYFGEDVFSGLSLLASAIGVLLVLLFLPGGFAEGMYRLRDIYLRWVADRHDLVVPSLFADRRIETGEGEQDVITAAEHHVETVELEPAALSVTCPTCGEVVALSDAPMHDHLRTPSVTR